MTQDPEFDPMEAFRAYRAVWPGRLALGVEIRAQRRRRPIPVR